MIAAAAAQLADPVRPGEGAQQPEPLALSGRRPCAKALEPAGGPLAQGPLTAMEQHGEALGSSQILFQQRHQIGRVGDNPCQTPGFQRPRAQQQAREPGMGTERRHGSALGGELLFAFGLHGAECHQQPLGAGHGGGGGHVQQRQALDPGSPLSGVQQQAGQLLGQDVRWALLGESLLPFAAPQPVTDAGTEAAGAAGPLGGGGLGNLTGLQSGDAALQIEAGTAFQAAVDDDRHAFNGEGGLSHIGGEHQLATARRRWLYGGLLGRHVQAAIERREAHIIR
ncbi:hypothetical protein D3C79_741570 [compost metagenome]